MDSEDPNNDQEITKTSSEIVTNNEKEFSKCSDNFEEDVSSIQPNIGNIINIEKDKDEQLSKVKEEEKYVESEFTKKYGYLVPSNDSIYGIHSYSQDYSGYKGYFDYSATQCITTPNNLYAATFASTENVEDTTSSNDDNIVSNNNLNYHDEENVDQNNDDKNRNENNSDDNFVLEEVVDDENEKLLNNLSINIKKGYVDNENEELLNDLSMNIKEESVDNDNEELLNHLAMNIKKEDIDSVITKKINENETRKRQHSDEINEYEPFLKKKDINDTKTNIATNNLNDINLFNDTSSSSETINTSDYDGDKKKRITRKSKSISKNQGNKKNISSEIKNKEKPLDIGNKLSQEMDISSVLGTDISMGVSALKPKIVNEIAKDVDEKKVTLNLRSTKKALPKPKLKVIVAKDTKNVSDLKSDIQYCDENKTLIKIKGSKIGIIDRKKIYTQLFNALKQQQVPEEEAKKLATGKEHKCAIEASDNSKYKSKCYNEIMKIKKRDCSPFVDKKTKKLEFSVDDINKFHEYLREYILTEEQLRMNEYPMWDSEKSDSCVHYEKGGTLSHKSHYSLPDEKQRVCYRCSKIFEVNDKTYEPTKKDVVCVYHSEKLMFGYSRYARYDKIFNCCGGSNGTIGCKEGDEHVTITQPYSNLKLFKECPLSQKNTTIKGVYALDCEMVLTVAGQDIARVTVVDMNCQIVYDQLIKPRYRVTDYCTEYSGITEELLKTNVLTLEQVQKKLFEFINQDTILIGHSFNCDLNALKLIHKNVVDTSITFPHRNPQFKNPLKKLAKLYLNMDIQEAHTGHDSAEDAIAAMKLLIAKYQGKI